MSADAVAWVWRHSPYSGATLLVHQAIADSVNDQHRNEFWMTVPRLATKARVSGRATRDAVHRLEADGMLHLVAQSSGRPGDPNRYRFLFPDLPVVYEPRWTGADPSPVPGPRRVKSATATGEHRSPKPKGNPSQSNPPAAPGAATPAKVPKPQTPARREADAIVRRWWEAHPGKPAHSFIGVVKVVESLLGEGRWRPDQIAAGLDAAPAPTVNAIKVAMAPRGRASGVGAAFDEIRRRTT